MFTSSMFESIKDALSNDNQSSDQAWREIMKTEKGKMYTVRLLPNVKDPKNTFFHYYSHAWESFQTGQFINLLSPQTFQERDPIGEYRYKVLRQGTPEEKQKAEAIKRREQWLINVYVIEDPTNPENEGKVKILRYGRQLNKILMDAIEGDDADQFGMRVFDLSENGCSLRIKVEDQGGFPTYVASKFLMPSAVDDMNSDEVLESLHDLEAVNAVKSQDELQAMFDEHYHCIQPGGSVPSPSTQSTTTPTAVVKEDDDDIPFDSKSVDLDDDPLDDDVVKDLLAGLDDE
jgi:hypothetical protein